MSGLKVRSPSHIPTPLVVVELLRIMRMETSIFMSHSSSHTRTRWVHGLDTGHTQFAHLRLCVVRSVDLPSFEHIWAHIQSHELFLLSKLGWRVLRAPTVHICIYTPQSPASVSGALPSCDSIDCVCIRCLKPLQVVASAPLAG
jgi:hypothetical protein